MTTSRWEQAILCDRLLQYCKSTASKKSAVEGTFGEGMRGEQVVCIYRRAGRMLVPTDSGRQGDSTSCSAYSTSLVVADLRVLAHRRG